MSYGHALNLIAILEKANHWNGKGMTELGENEIYPEDSPLAINNYALGYQDYFGFRSDNPKVLPVAPDNESYMRGWYSAQMHEIENRTNVKPKRAYGSVKLEAEWRQLAKQKGWREDFSIG